MPVIGEQAEVVIETGRLPRARLIPERAVHGFDGAQGMVWTIKDGKLAQQRVRFAARLMDGRVALIAEDLPEAFPVAVQVGPRFVEGRAARPVVQP